MKMTSSTPCLCVGTHGCMRGPTAPPSVNVDKVARQGLAHLLACPRKHALSTMFAPSSADPARQRTNVANLAVFFNVDVSVRGRQCVRSLKFERTPFSLQTITAPSCSARPASPGWEGSYLHLAQAAASGTIAAPRLGRRRANQCAFDFLSYRAVPWLQSLQQHDGIARVHCGRGLRL